MAYYLTIDVRLSDEDDIRVSVNREYKIENLAEIRSIFEHAGHTLSVASEGVERFGPEVPSADPVSA